jgi:pimeloyl-ACP methyl ester carboxylesterase
LTSLLLGATGTLAGGCASLGLEQLEGTRNLGVQGGVLEVSVQGQGSPAVVFESGAGAACRMGNWAKVIEGLRGETKLFAYNRSGYGRSRIRRSLDDPKDVVEALHRVLQEADVKPPYLLVGHSLGGLYLNLFARIYPDEVSGLVLIDSSHPEQFDHLRREKPLRHAMMVASYAKGSPDLRYEMANMNAFRHEVERAGPFPEIPVVVLTAGKSWQGEDREWWFGLQRDLASLSRLGRGEIVESAGHFIHQDEPEVVVGVIKELLARELP